MRMMLNPQQVKEKSGPMFSRRFLAMVNASRSLAETIALSEARAEAAALYNDRVLPLIKK